MECNRVSARPTIRHAASLTELLQSRQQLLARVKGDPLRRGAPVSSLVAPSKQSRYSKINWLTCIVLVVFHALAVAALFQFTWTNLIVAAVLYWVAVGLGISMGYHRLH